MLYPPASSIPPPRSPGAPRNSSWPSPHTAGWSSPPTQIGPSAPTCTAVPRTPGCGPHQQRISWPRSAGPPPSEGGIPRDEGLTLGLIRFDQTLRRTLEGKSQMVQPDQAAAAAQTDAQAFRDKLPNHPANTSWPVGCPMWQAGCSTAAFNSSCCAWSRAVGTTGLLEYQECGTALAEGRRPPELVEGVRRREGSRSSDSAVAAAVESWASSSMAYHRSRSLGVGARIIRRRKALASICHPSINRSMSLTPITNPLRRPEKLFLPRIASPKSLPNASGCLK